MGRVAVVGQHQATTRKRLEGVDSNSPTGSWASFSSRSFSPKAGQYRPLLLGTWLGSSFLCPWYYLGTLVHWLFLLALALSLLLASVVSLVLASAVPLALAQALALAAPLAGPLALALTLALALALALVLTLALPLASDLTPSLLPLWLPFGEVGRVPPVFLEIVLLEVAVGGPLQEAWTHIHGRGKELPSRHCVPRLPLRYLPPPGCPQQRPPLEERSLLVPNRSHWEAGHPPIPLLMSRLSLLLHFVSRPGFPPWARQTPGCMRKEVICQSCVNVRANVCVLMRVTNSRLAIL